jgi:uncharacterized surface protein with fasciclin (FAS1) repeats
MKKIAIYTGKYIPLLLVMLLAFVLSCSSPSTTTPPQTSMPGASDTLTTTTPSANTSSLASVPISAVVPEDSMFAYFVSNGSLTIFAAAVDSTSLIAELKGKGPYTVFTPTDEAFAKLPPGQKNAYFNDTAKLKELLLYHVVQGNYSASQLTPSTSLTTLQGEKLEIKISNSQITVNGAKFVLTDVPATDGVIHIIDTVLIPPSWSLTSPSGPASLPPPSSVPSVSTP